MWGEKYISYYWNTYMYILLISVNIRCITVIRFFIRNKKESQRKIIIHLFMEIIVASCKEKEKVLKIYIRYSIQKYIIYFRTITMCFYFLLLLFFTI